MNLPCKVRHILDCLYLNEGFGDVLRIWGEPVLNTWLSLHTT